MTDIQSQWILFWNFNFFFFFNQTGQSPAYLFVQLLLEIRIDLMGKLLGREARMNELCGTFWDR